MKLEKKNVTAKPRKLKGTWTVDIKDIQTTEELEEEFRVVYDRWCWETGSDEDKKLLDDLLEQILFRKSHDAIMEEAMQYMADEIRNEIDKEILKDLMKHKK